MNNSKLLQLALTPRPILLSNQIIYTVCKRKTISPLTINFSIINKNHTNNNYCTFSTFNNNKNKYNNIFDDGSENKKEESLLGDQKVD